MKQLNNGKAAVPDGTVEEPFKANIEEGQIDLAIV